MQVRFNNQDITFRKFQWGFSKELHKNQENIFSWKKPSVLLSKMPCRLFVKMTIFQDGSKVLVSGGNIIKINFIASIFRTLHSEIRTPYCSHYLPDPTSHFEWVNLADLASRNDILQSDNQHQGPAKLLTTLRRTWKRLYHQETWVTEMPYHDML